MKQTETVTAGDAGQRLDVWCVRHVPEYSRAMLQRAIKEGAILVNGEVQKPRYTVREGDVVAADIPEAQVPQEEQEPLVLPILHEDEHIVVINKPAGVVVHEGIGREQRTVASWFAKRYPNAHDVGDPGRAGIVHRLDKDTSGVMVLAKTRRSFDHLKRQFKKHHARKEYLALVFGVPGEKKGRITRPLARSARNPMRRTVDPSGKPAITEWVLEESFGSDYALLRVFLLTGRTHQIRAHLHFLGFPIVGDPLYHFKRKSLPEGAVARNGQMLHAQQLGIMLLTGKRKVFIAPLPEDFENVLNELRAKS